jgi:hypothetical protein
MASLLSRNLIPNLILSLSLGLRSARDERDDAQRNRVEHQE